MLNRSLTPAARACAPPLMLGVLRRPCCPTSTFYWAGDRDRVTCPAPRLDARLGSRPGVVALALALLAPQSGVTCPSASCGSIARPGQASHTFFDWITSYGTHVLHPVHAPPVQPRLGLHHRPLLHMGIPLAALLAGFLWRARARRAALARGCPAGRAYIGLLRRAARAGPSRSGQALDHVAPGAKVAVVPQLLSPFRWLGLAEHDSEVHAAFFDIGPFAKGIRQSSAASGWLIDVPRVLPDFYPPPERVRACRCSRGLRSPPPAAAARALEEVRICYAPSPVCRWKRVKPARGRLGGVPRSRTCASCRSTGTIRPRRRGSGERAASPSCTVCCSTPQDELSRGFVPVAVLRGCGTVAPSAAAAAGA